MLLLYYGYSEGTVFTNYQKLCYKQLDLQLNFEIVLLMLWTKPHCEYANFCIF